MRKNRKKYGKDKFESYFEELSKISKNAPQDEEILAEFKCGDFSSIDPEFFKTGHDMCEKFLSFQKKRKKQRKNESKKMEIRL